MFKVGDRVEKVSNGPSDGRETIAPVGSRGVVLSIGGTTQEAMNRGYTIAIQYDGIDAGFWPHCVAMPSMLRKLDDTWAKDKVAYVINSQDALIGTDKRDLLVTK